MYVALELHFNQLLSSNVHSACCRAVSGVLVSPPACKEAFARLRCSVEVVQQSVTFQKVSRCALRSNQCAASVASCHAKVRLLTQ